MAKTPKVPFNCLLPAGTVKAIRDQAEADKCSQADVVHRAIALLCFGEEIVGQAIAPRLAYSSELAAIKKQVTPQGGFTSELDATANPAGSTQGKATTETWRTERPPLLKPKDKTR